MRATSQGNMESRLLRGDVSSQKRSRVPEANNEPYENDAEEFDWNEEEPEADEDEANTHPSRNYGRSVNGPWVGGLYLRLITRYLRSFYRSNNNLCLV